MQKNLADFRIENDNLILLSFSNGSKYRVSQRDLSKVLTRQDIVKVQKAMARRHRFMKRVLPPTAAILLSAGVLVAGSGDVSRVMQLQNRPAAHQESELSAPDETVTTAQAATTSASSSPAAPLTTHLNDSLSASKIPAWAPASPKAVAATSKPKRVR